MSEEMRQLATAIMALADSNRGIGAVLQAQVESLHVQEKNHAETNRFLSDIARQNALILEQVEKSNERFAESSSQIRAVKKTIDDSKTEQSQLKSTVRRYGERLDKVEEVLGIDSAES